MLTLHCGTRDSYLHASERKDFCRDLIAKNLRRIIRSNPVSRSYYLTLGGAGATDVKKVRELLPTQPIISVERDRKRLASMLSNAPAGLIAELGDMKTFLEGYRPRPSSNPNDGHFAGVYLDWLGGVCESHVLSSMTFVADHRFMKPGMSSLIAITYEKAIFNRLNVDEAYAATLYHGRGAPRPFYNLDDTANYSMVALREGCPALELKLLHTEEYRNGDDKEVMFFILIEAFKPSWAPEYDLPRNRIRSISGGHKMIGGLHLPKHGRNDGSTHNLDPITIAPELEREIAALAGSGELTMAELDLIAYARMGGAQPLSKTRNAQVLAYCRMQPGKAWILDLLRRMGVRWSLAQRTMAA